MKLWKAWALLFTVALVVSPNAAAARTETRTYEAAAIIVSASFEDPAGATTDGFVDLGGVAFTTLATDTTATVVVSDAIKAQIDPANKDKVAAELCQDINGDHQCDISQLFCGSVTVSLGTDPLGFQGGFDLVVFVYLTELRVGVLALKPCAGATLQRAYTGTVTATFAP